MAVFNEVFPNKLSPKIPPGAERDATQERLDGGNISVTMSDAFGDDIKALKAQLDARNIKLGDVIGVGNMGGITFEMMDKNDRIIEGAVLRIDPTDMVTSLPSPNPAAIRPIHREESGYYTATIVPLAKKATFTNEQIAEALAVLNTDERLPYLKDLERNQFMQIPGIPVPVLTDLSCVGAEPNSLVGLGTIDTFIGMLKMDSAKVKATRVPPEKMQELRDIQNGIHERAVAELKKAGVNLDPVPSQQQSTILTPLEADKHRAREQ